MDFKTCLVISENLFSKDISLDLEFLFILFRDPLEGQTIGCSMMLFNNVNLSKQIELSAAKILKE